IHFVNIENEQYQLTGSVNTAAYPAVEIQNVRLLDGEDILVEIDGTVSDDKLDFWFKSHNLDLQDMFALLDQQQIVTGKANVYWVMSGTRKNPRIVCTASASSGLVLKVPYESFNAQWFLRDGILDIETCDIVFKKMSDISLKGRVPLFSSTEEKEITADRPIDFSLSISQGDLNILTKSMDFVKSARGNLTGMLAVTGTIQSPSYNGYMKISNGTISSEKYFKNMKALDALIEFRGTTAEIKSLQARLGDGMLEITGNSELGWLTVEQMNLHVFSSGDKGIRIEAPMLPISSSPLFKRITTTSHGKPKVDFFLTGTPDAPRVSGKAYLDNTFFTYPPSPEAKKKYNGADNPVLDFIRRTLWDIELLGGNNTWYENQYANASINGNLIIQGRYPNFKVSARLESGKGSIGFLGSEFQIKNAVFEIIPIKHEQDIDEKEWRNIPYLEGSAETLVYYKLPQINNSIEDTITMVMDRAPIGELKPRFVSRNDPNLSSDKALERATGYDAENIDPKERDLLLKRGIVQVLDATLTTPIARNILRYTGLVDTIRISHENLPDASSDPILKKDPVGLFETKDFFDAFLGTKYTVGKQLSSKLLLEYSMQIVGLEQKLDLRHELELSYRLRGDTYVRAVTDINRNVSGGYEPEQKAVIERRWRFNWPPKWKSWIKPFLPDN
ncbi:MAG: hypothetical protein ABII23_06150, partial [bacterium]